ncbi:FtsX-like permease family protein [Ramlibacter tataouinensis]|uniref:ABC transporter permease n=1 Tax=Ramlibacter tataouinensis TaxID=94132 RepID=UPI0022F3BE87|nr:FtsX-like permease family protein [Ramlibacter tataouinensis]WBY02578.1 FtsX-like permease family protein [Ramlibacter tataouinensis]
MKALDRKVLRDLRLLWSQAMTIALVVASGVASFVTTRSAVDSLASARDSFYAAARFADVFASARRAPDSLAQRLRGLPGVVDVQTTVESGARVTVPGSTDPVIGHLIGRPSRQAQRLNLVSLRTGRFPQGGAHAGGELEAAVSEGFALARGLRPGDHVEALVNGKMRRLRITGLALSPEYVFAGLFGMPDLRAFGVFWLDEDELAAALDMRGAFNRVALKLEPQASQPAVVDAATRLLAPYGGLLTRTRSEQASEAMLDNEIRSQQVIGTLLPAIFLGVAAFLLHVVTARLVATQREQVAALKALGYRDRSIALHYLKLVAPMVGAGFLLGLAAGKWMGVQLMGLYTEVFRFPVLVHAVPPGLVAASLAIVALTAVAGALTAIGSTVRLQPAEAMRPPAPGTYRRSLLERLPRLRTGPALRMILRNIERRPLRTAVTVGGIAFAVAIVVLGNFFRDAIEVIVDANFNLGMRGDVAVWTVDPVPAGEARAFARIPGVQQVEAGRRVEVRFLKGHRSETGVIQGRPADSRLQRVIDVDRRSVPIPLDGLLMGDRLAAKLGLRPGDTVTVEFREGRRPVREVVVERTVRDMMGLNAWLERRALNRLLGEGDVASEFTLGIEPGRTPQVLQATQEIRGVAGAFSKASMQRNMEQVTARNILIMSTILTTFAAVIAVGVVYNNARIALAERSWELASLRVLGFTRAEASLLLLGELALGIAIALPIGMLLGWGLTHLLVGLLQTDQFLFPVVIRPRTYAWAAICILASGAASALVVRRRVDRLDMVAALKTRE